MPYPILQPDPASSAPANFDEDSTAQDRQVRALMRQHNVSYAEAVTLWMTTGTNPAGYESIASKPELAPIANGGRLAPFSPSSFSEQSLGDDKLVRQCAADWGMSYQDAMLALIQQGSIAAP